MTTYNHARYIEQAIESVAIQKTNFPFEILIGEDCSTDGTREHCQRIADKYPDKIRLFLHEHNLGGHENCRRIYNACRGEFIAFCEGDDYWCNHDKIQKQVTVLDEHPDWSGCFHRTRVIDETPGIPDSFFPLRVPSAVVSLEELAAENYISTCSVMYRRRIVPVLPEWFFDLVLGDWPLSILYAIHGPLGYLNEVMSVYRKHSGGMWSTLDMITRIDHTLRALFAVEAHCEEPVRSILVAGRREFLSRSITRHVEDLVRLRRDEELVRLRQDEELVRLRKIEARYRLLQLHRIAAIGKWLKSLVGK